MATEHKAKQAQLRAKTSREKIRPTGHEESSQTRSKASHHRASPKREPDDKFADQTQQGDSIFGIIGDKIKHAGHGLREQIGSDIEKRLQDVDSALGSGLTGRAQDFGQALDHGFDGAVDATTRIMDWMFPGDESVADSREDELDGSQESETSEPTNGTSQSDDEDPIGSDKPHARDEMSSMTPPLEIGGNKSEGNHNDSTQAHRDTIIEDENAWRHRLDRFESPISPEQFKRNFEKASRRPSEGGLQCPRLTGSIGPNGLPAGTMIWANYWSLAKWLLNEDWLPMGLAGDVTQATLDDPRTGLNYKTYVYEIYAKNSAWDQLGKALGKKFDYVNFTFLPAFTLMTTAFTCNTLIEVPVLIAAPILEGKNPTFRVDPGAGNVVEVAGQIVLATGVVNVWLWSGTYKIDRAMEEIGDFFIQPDGAYYFGGQAPDPISLAGYSAPIDKLRYNDRYWAQLIGGNAAPSTVEFDGGQIDTASTGVIFLASNASLVVKQDCRIGGNVVIGWDRVVVSLGAKIALLDDAKVFSNADVDFKNFGFSGNGRVVITGSNWNEASNAFVPVQVHIGSGATIGNLSFGYNAFLADGIGGSPYVSDSGKVDPQPNYGGTLLVEGDVTLSGVFSIGGGDGVNGIATIAADSKLISGAITARLDVANANGVLDIGDRVSFGVGLTVEGGTVNCGLSDAFGSVTLTDGTINIVSGDTISTLALNGGTFNAVGATDAGNPLIINSIDQAGGVFKAYENDSTGFIRVDGTISVRGGRFEVANLTCHQTITISDAGAARFGQNCQIDELIVDTSGDVSLWSLRGSLTTGEHATGTTTVVGPLGANVSVKGGTLLLTGQDKTIIVLDMTGGILDARDAAVTATSLNLQGGEMTFKSLVVQKAFVVSGGSISADHVTFGDQIIIKGSGSVNFADGNLNSVDVQGSGSNNIGANFKTLVLEKSATGTTTVTSKDLADIQVSGGKLVIATDGSRINHLIIAGGMISAAGSVTVAKFDVSGGISTFNDLRFTGGNLQVIGGTLTAKLLSFDDLQGVLTVSQSGAVSIDAGALETVTFSSASNSSFGSNTTIDALTLDWTQAGTVTFNGTTLKDVTVKSGVLEITGKSHIAHQAFLKGGSIKISSGGGLTFDTTAFTSTEKAYLTLDNGALYLNATGELTLNAVFLVTAAGGEVVLGSTGNSILTLASNIEVDGKLSLVGVNDSGKEGHVNIAHDISGTGNIVLSNVIACTVTCANISVGMEVDAGCDLLFANPKATWVNLLKLNGGSAKATSEVDTNALQVINGGHAWFARLSVAGNIDVEGVGSELTLSDVNCGKGVLSIRNGGRVDIASGTISTVVLDGSGSSTICANIGTLKLDETLTGALTLTGGYINDLTVTGGALYVDGQVTAADNLQIVKGLLSIKGVLIDSAAVSEFAASASVVLNGGVLSFQRAGQVTFECDFTVSASGGTIETVAGGTVTFNNAVHVDGVLNITGAGTIVIDQNVSAASADSAINVGSGVTLIIAAGASITPPINVAAGAHIVFSEGASTSVTLNISDEAARAGCSICFDDTVALSSVSHIKVNIINFCDGVKLDLRVLKLNGVRIEKAYYLQGKIHIVYEVLDSKLGDLGLHELVFDGVSGPNLQDNYVLTIEDDGNGGTDIETCFLKGTKIETPQGWRRIETLLPGDMVFTYEGDQRVGTAVRWVGQGEVTCRPDMPDDLAGYAVRIARDAISPGVPEVDVYVTSEHCLYIDGGLIPARMLVNGGSIAYAHNLRHYRFYHLETASHAIVSASNLKAETYLDTGNRKRFSAGRGVVGLRPDPDAPLAAPLTVDAGVVAPIHQRLRQSVVNQRCLAVQPMSSRVAPATTTESDLSIVLPDGREIKPVGQRGRKVIFNLPAHARMVTLKSRASRPFDAIGPWVDDRRDLGVLVGAITIVTASRIVEVSDHLTSDAPGWWEDRAQDCRWTNGSATLRLPDFSSQPHGAIFAVSCALHIEILAQGPYLVEDRAARQCSFTRKDHSQVM